MDKPHLKRHYARELDAFLARLDGPAPSLLLHVCCAPCSSAVLEQLCPHFDVSILYYNPNISPQSEYEKRLTELLRLTEEMPLPRKPRLVSCGYNPEAFAQAVQGLEGEPEGGARCLACYRLRLEEAARAAKDLGLDYFTTTLSISPLKNAQALNQIGEELGARYGVKHLPADFKKKEGYKRSIELSRAYGLYRQDYCGCSYSRAQREREKQEKEGLTHAGEA
ncbi:MAG: epoxyqueuosine reductase QueH [Acutalibacter sp.]|nr:epoxyqueuosine reductase QueH [Acutalibacter sp.]